jgi:hydroxyacylglutathione hydrolase
MKVEVLASRISDNFFYLLHEGKDGIVVDPVDAKLAIERVNELGLDDVRVLITHGHPDHIAGNDEFVDATGALVMAPASATRFPCPHDIGLQEGDVIPLGDSELHTWHVPGHTDDHLMYFTPENLFVGDLLFFAGVGHCKFGGEVGALFRSVARLAELPADARVFPGHDYSTRNAEFGLSVISDDMPLSEMLKRSRATESRTLFATTLGRERQYNPFLRAHLPEVQAGARAHGDAWEMAGGADDVERTFRVLRALRDGF